MILAFFYAALGEFAWLAWIYFASRAWPLRAALAAMAIGAFGACGIREGLKSRSRMVALILGYGAGSYAAAVVRGWL